MPTTHGIDASRYQGTPDWVAVKGHLGVCGFVFLKATDSTSYSHVDWFRHERTRALAAGLQVGAYHFADTTRDPVAQARYFYLTAGHLDPIVVPGGELPAYILDLEKGTGDLSTWALRFLSELELLTNRTPGFYSYAPFIREHIRPNAPGLSHFPLWIAGYRSRMPVVPSPWQTAVLWQYSSQAHIPGIVGNVDVNQLVSPVHHEPLVAPSRQEDLMRDYVVVDIPKPDDLGRQVVGLPQFKFDTVSSVQIKANDDGRPVKALAQPWAYGADLVVSFVPLAGTSVPVGKVGLIIEHR